MAYDIINKGGLELKPRGGIYFKARINARLNIGEFFDSLRTIGVQFGVRPMPLSHKDRVDLCDALGLDTKKVKDKRLYYGF